MANSSKSTMRRLMRDPNWIILLALILLLIVFLVRDISRGKGWIGSAIVLTLIGLQAGFAFYLERGLSDNEADEDSSH